MQALEDHEDLLRVLRVDADAVVGHREERRRLERLDADVDARRVRVRNLIDCEQVLEELGDLRLVPTTEAASVVR